MKEISIRFAYLLWLALISSSVLAQARQLKPLPNTYVHDFAHVINDYKKAEIQAKAKRLKDEFKTEIAIVTIKSLQGEDSFDYSMRMARSWGIGSKDNAIRGLLILVAIDDRKTAFRTSRHIEGELPDGVTGEISRRMAVYFKQGDYGAGLSLGMDEIISRLTPKRNQAPMYAPIPKPESSAGYWIWALLGLAGIGAAIKLITDWKLKNADDAFIEGSIRRSRRRFPLMGNEVRHRKTPSTRADDTRFSWAEHASTQSPSSDWFSSDRSSSMSAQEGSPPSYDSGSSFGGSSDFGSSGSNFGSGDSSYSGGSDFGGGGSDSSW